MPSSSSEPNAGSPIPQKSSPAKRRQVREAAVQLLHALRGQELSEESEAAIDSRQNPWTLILAQSDEKILRLRAKALLHLQQNRAAKGEAIAKNGSQVATLLKTFADEQQSATSYRALLKTEELVAENLDLLRRQLKSSKDSSTLAETLNELRSHNESAHRTCGTLIEDLRETIELPTPLQATKKSLPILAESISTARSLFQSDPLSRSETAALHKALAEQASLKQAVSELYQLIASHLTETDSLLAEHLENFAPERLAQVDRAVLRLAVTELHHCSDVPHAVVINEAIEVARRFGGNESASFVNGVLDALKP